MPGRIEQLQVGTSDRVQAGQALAELSSPEQFQAAIAAAELGVVLAQNNLNSLHDQANHQLALAEQALADANKDVETATWQAASAKQPYSQQAIAQAYANQMLAKKQLDQLRKDQAKVEKLLSDPTSFIWRYVKRKLVKEQALFLQSAVANADAKYQDAVQKYEDRLKPPDPIDVAKAEANLAAAQALANKARLDRDRLMNGPDPDELARLEAELLAAQGKLEVAQSALDATQLSAPIAGQVADVQVKAGEWASPGQTVLVIADLDHWIVQCDELTQDEIVALQPDQSVQVTLDALPELSLAGTVEQIGLTYRDIRDESRYQAKIALDEAPPGLRWGMTSRITIPSAQ
jgi:HlyD family secretion protein